MRLLISTKDGFQYGTELDIDEKALHSSMVDFEAQGFVETTYLESIVPAPTAENPEPRPIGAQIRRVVIPWVNIAAIVVVDETDMIAVDDFGWPLRSEPGEDGPCSVCGGEGCKHCSAAPDRDPDDE